MKPSAKAGGFTLLEMMIALFILAVVLGMALFSTKNALADEDIRRAARELQVLAKTARNRSIDSNRRHELLLGPHFWEMKTAAETPAEPEGRPAQAEAAHYELPEEIRWKVRRWGSSQWEIPKDLAWPFSTAGLCAPHRFRFERGASWIEFTINPLTANAQDEEFYLP